MESKQYGRKLSFQHKFNPEHSLLHPKLMMAQLPSWEVAMGKFLAKLSSSILSNESGYGKAILQLRVNLQMNYKFLEFCHFQMQSSLSKHSFRCNKIEPKKQLHPVQTNSCLVTTIVSCQSGDQYQELIGKTTDLQSIKQATQK